jgi:hypothetical protein
LGIPYLVWKFQILKFCGKSILEEAFPDLFLEIPDLGIPEFCEKFQNYIFKKNNLKTTLVYMWV